MADGWLVASYNALNQPVAMVPFGWANAIYFGYDPLGRCVKRWVDASGDVYSNPATYFYYDGWNLIQEGSSSTDAQRQYVHGARMDEIVAQITPPNNWIRYFHYDASGNCTLQTDASGNIVEQYEYDAFGYPYFFDGAGSPATVNGQPGSPFGNRFLFTGREWLSDLKLYDFRNRMYQPELGRFLQPDPKEFAAGDYNLYRYCHNDPVNRSDPTGLRDEIIAEVQQLKKSIESNISHWVTIGTLTTRFQGGSWQEASMKAAAVAVKAAHSTQSEHFGIAVHRPHSNVFYATTPIAGIYGKVYGGYYNQSDFATLRVPGFEMAAGYWAIIRFQNSWPMHGKESDLDVLKRTHTNAVLGMPATATATDAVTYKIHDDHPVP
jgi:RHS repeat-associated protein